MLNDNFDFDNSVSITDINFSVIKNNNAPELVNIIDNMKCIYENKELTIVASRNINFEPENLFKLEINAEIKLYEKDTSDYVHNETITAKEISKEFEPAVNVLFSYLSSAASYITMTSGLVPIITPPQFVEQP